MDTLQKINPLKWSSKRFALFIRQYCQDSIDQLSQLWLAHILSDIS
jgi:hypothetical protein